MTTMHNPASLGELLKAFLGDTAGRAHRYSAGHCSPHPQWPHRHYHGYQHPAGPSSWTFPRLFLKGSIAARLVDRIQEEAAQDQAAGRVREVLEVDVAGNSEELLRKGSSLLAPLLTAHGFASKLLSAGESSGGRYATGEFRKGDRWLELHFRFSLGMVSYHLASLSMSHLDYMRSVIGVSNSSHYPGFSSDPLDGFRHLLLDLQEHGSEFLAGSDECLAGQIEMAKNLPPPGCGLPD